jgi:type I restriction-modification system specificity subunit
MIEKRLIDISRNISSGITPLRSNDEFWANGTIPWLKTEQLGEKYIFDTNEHITEKALQEANVKIFPENTLSIAMYGEGKTRGNVSILKRPMATNQACCNIELDAEKVSSEYVYYFLKTQYENLRGLSSGIRKNLNTNDIKNFVVRLPENLKTQQSIAAVLSALDKKIALNKQINARLEEMAKTLYDYWFVQFDFPDANGKPYKSSGGEMVFDETLKREIPKGWEVKNLGDWAEIRKGTLITEKTANTNGDIKVISAGVDFSYYHDVANRPKNTITISASGANAGFVNFWREPIFACDCTTITNRVIGSTLYILNFLKIVQDFIYQQARGSAQPHVYPKDIEGLKIIVPPDLLLKRFSEFVENWNLKIANNEKQNHQLTQLRDFLLPMLMNGQVSVAE